MVVCIGPPRDHVRADIILASDLFEKIVESAHPEGPSHKLVHGVFRKGNCEYSSIIHCKYILMVREDVKGAAQSDIIYPCHRFDNRKALFSRYGPI